MLADVSGWVRRGGILRTPSGPKGSSGNQVILGAAGEPARAFCFNSKSRSIKFQYKMVDSKLFLS